MKTVVAKMQWKLCEKYRCRKADLYLLICAESFKLESCSA